MRKTPNAEEWMADANCLTTDSEIFFPHKGSSARAAKKICSRCTVRPSCLTYALTGEANEIQDHRTTYWAGVYGGLTQRERRRLRHHQQAS